MPLIGHSVPTALPQADQAIIFLVAGYIDRSIQNSLTCKSCCLLLSTGETLQAQIKECESSSEIIKAREKFLISMSRGGLQKPTDILYVTCIHASGQLFKFQNPLNLFLKVFKQKLTEKNNTACILDDKCKDRHNFLSFVEKISMSMFNTWSNNVLSEMNSSCWKTEVKHFKFKETQRLTSN